MLKPKLILPCNTCHVSPSDVYRIAIKEGNNKTICVLKINRGSNIITLSLCKKKHSDISKHSMHAWRQNNSPLSCKLINWIDYFQILSYYHRLAKKKQKRTHFSTNLSVTSIECEWSQHNGILYNNKHTDKSIILTW